jgi:hypothetical protein
LHRRWTEIFGVNPLNGTVFCEHGWRFLANCNRNSEVGQTGQYKRVYEDLWEPAPYDFDSLLSDYVKT